jgi:hypothetical protein
MAWDYDYRIGATSLSDYCEAITIQDESAGGLLGSDIHVPGTDGVRSMDNTIDATVISLKTVLRYTNAGGTITHADGAPGHVYENRAALMEFFRTPGGATLRRDMPHAGTVDGIVKLLGDPIRGEADNVFTWPLNLLKGSWRGDTQQSQVGNPPTITTLGDVRIDEMEIEFSGAGTVSDTDGDGNVYSVQALAGTFPLIVYTGTNKRVEQGGSPDPGRVVIGHEAWFRMDPNTSISLTTDVSVTVRWYDRWS